MKHTSIFNTQPTKALDQSAWVTACASTCLLLSLFGCSALLPSSKIEMQTPWKFYEEAQLMFEKIVVGNTRTEQLKSLGIDAVDTPNVAVLSHAELIRRFASMPAIDASMLDEKLRRCFENQQKCSGLEIEQRHSVRERVGSFWLDFLGFYRKTRLSGWKFNAVIVLNDGVVVYKVWTGTPNINEVEENKYPLGPFQSIGEAALRQR